VQLRLICQLSAEQYVERRLWESASLLSCPLHPQGGCGFSGHGTYERREPAGARVARSYCPTGKVTFSLLPDCLASRLPATLEQVESAAALVESSGSAAAAARQLHPFTDQIDHVQGTERRLRRWHRGLLAALVSLAGLIPEKLAGYPPTLQGWRAALGREEALVALRGEAAQYLGHLAPPLGLGPRPTSRKEARRRLQQRAGPDPPPTSV
jgi:hypothetical protein